VFALKLSAMALAVAAMFGAFAFANTFAVNGNEGQENQEDIASAGASVDFCNHNVEVDIDGVFSEHVDGGINDNGDNVLAELWVRTDPACDGYQIVVTLTGTAEPMPLSSYPVEINSQDMQFTPDDFGHQFILISDITDVHVLIDGDNGGDPPAVD